jgi:alkanesulfonate monooxygenase
MPVEFLGIAATNDGSEITARSGASFDKEYTLRLARAHEENGWDRVLFAYGSGSPDPNAAAAYIASVGQHVIPIVREEVAKRDRATAGAGGPTA